MNFWHVAGLAAGLFLLRRNPPVALATISPARRPAKIILSAA